MNNTILKIFISKTQRMVHTMIESFCGFEFECIGQFYICNTPSAKEYSWQGQTFHITTCLKLIDEKHSDVRESAYLIKVEDAVTYVGEFSDTLKSRFLKSEPSLEHYVDHNKDKLINDLLRKGFKITLWLLREPNVTLESGVNLNISKSVEHHILKNKLLDWNKRNNGPTMIGPEFEVFYGSPSNASVTS